MLSHLLTGIAAGSSLFLVAAGLTVIFGVSRVVNFAHGSLTMLGAYIGWSVLRLLPADPVSFTFGVGVTALVLAGLGVLLEIGLLRRIYQAPELFQLLATFALVLIVQDLVPWIWGPEDHVISRPRWLRGFVIIGDDRFPGFDLALIVIGGLVLVLLWLLLTRTRWGGLIRAATEDREMVSALGVDQRLLFTSVFALGAGLAGLGGVLMLPGGSANPQIDLTTITDAFVVVVVGGLGSVPGAYLAAMLIGVLHAFGVMLIPKATLVLSFLVMALVLAVRPNGLLGKAASGAAVGAAAVPPLIRPQRRMVKALYAGLLVLAVLAPLFVGPYPLSIMTEAAIAMLFAISLHLMMGPGGMASFGHAAWFGIGAYAAAFVTHVLQGAMPFGLVLAPIAAGIVAALFGWFVVRLSGVYLAMLTLAFAQIVWAVVFQSVDLTGGDNGVLDLWPDAWAHDPRVFFWLTLALTAGGVWLVIRLLYTPFGYGLRAARDSTLRAEAIGLDTQSLRMAAFALSGAMAGLAGGLFTYAKGAVFPTYISIPRSVDALMMVLLGGVQTLSGPVIGALVYTGLYDWLLTVTSLWRLCLGIAILCVVLLFPEGIAGAAQRLLPECADR